MSEWRDEIGIEVEEIKAETDKAILAVLSDREIWIPKSQVSDNSEVYEKGDSGTLIISPWFAEKEGLDG